MKTYAIGVATIIVGCATDSPTMTEPADGEYLRETTRIETVERFEQLKKACSLAGGVMQVHRQSSGRQRPTIDEMRQATCGSRSRIGGFF